MTVNADHPQKHDAVHGFIAACHAIGQAYVAMLARQFPVFLVPGPNRTVMNFESFYSVKIFWEESSWYLVSSETDQRLFSFDLPRELFNLYADQERLTRAGALELKAEKLNQIQIVVREMGVIKVITLELDPGWLDALRQNRSQT